MNESDMRRLSQIQEGLDIGAEWMPRADVEWLLKWVSRHDAMPVEQTTGSSSFMVYVSQVAGMGFALRAMRMPMKSQSDLGGPKDIELSRRLIHAGDEHGKHARMINVWMTIKAPRYWWQEWNTYTIGVVQAGDIVMDSESTMHTLLKEGVRHTDCTPETAPAAITLVNRFIDEKAGLRTVKANLPEGFLQTRAIATNYQAMRRIVCQRHAHRLSEWQTLFEAWRKLPYAGEFIF